MEYKKTMRAYERQHVEFPVDSGIDSVVFEGMGQREIRPAFRHQNLRFSYERHGYENVFPFGDEVLAARFTPEKEGEYTFRAMKGDECVFSGSFEVTEKAPGAGFVGVSEKDPRYFALNDGTGFVPVGVNLTGPDSYAAASGVEFGKTEARDTMGAAQYRHWLKEFSANGGNYIRLWLDNFYFTVDHEQIDEFDLAGFARLDRVLDIAREYGVRVKLTFEHFRAFDIVHTNAPVFVKTRKAGERACLRADEWLTEDIWQDAWFRKIDQYLARYGNDPVVFSFELWNEQNAMDADFGNVAAFTKKACAYLRKNAPRNMAVNSLGSYDFPAHTKCLDAFKMDEMSYQQFHRYLDQGAKLAIVTGDPIAFIKEGVHNARRPDRPVILAETGAVNDCHSGTFRYYSYDHEGIILTDEVYAPFFFESAGTGQNWHWSSYIEANDLWKYYKPFSDMLQGEDVTEQGLSSHDLSTPAAWILLLEGKDTVYGYVKNTLFNWYNVLRDDNPVDPVDISFPLPFDGELTLYRPWADDLTGACAADGEMKVAGMKKGFLFKLKKK